MSSPATNAIGVKLQAAGENLNTWGVSPNLNDALQVLANIGVKWNPLTINSGATTTISEVNYATTNDTEVATIDLVAGTVAAAFALVLPGRAKQIVIRNSAGYAATIKLAATTGFALPTGRIAIVATDGTTDVVNLTPNFGGITVPTTGSGDIPAWSAVEAAIAAAGLPASAGTVLNSGTDTTAGYLSNKVTSANAIAAWTTQSAGGNEKALLTVNPGALLDGGQQTGPFTAVASTAYLVTSGVLINLPSTVSAPAKSKIELTFEGTGPWLLTGTIDNVAYTNSSPYAITDEQTLPVKQGATRGWH